MLASLLLAFNFIGFLKGLMMTFFMISAFLLMLVVLIQEPKGGGLSSAFGGVGAETFGVQTGGVNKFTAWVAGIWMFLAVLYAAIRPEGTGEAPSLRDVETPPGVEAPVDEGGEPAVGVPPGEGESEGAGDTGEK
jgi:preprotein translocase subunit SecG